MPFAAAKMDDDGRCLAGKPEIEYRNKKLVA
jgi:hypothetical protein